MSTPTAWPLGVARVAVENIDPAAAAAMLDGNTHNRPGRPADVARYADAMRRGQWIADAGDPIRIAADGTLLDGQNRLAAIIQADATLPFVVVRDVPVEAQDVIDTGKRR